jgi:hypothetical protein
MKKVKIYEPTTEDIIDLMHRMTGYNEDVLIEYIRVFKIKDPGRLTLSDIYNNQKTAEMLYFVQRRIKIRKLMSKIK